MVTRLNARNGVVGEGVNSRALRKSSVSEE